MGSGNAVFFDHERLAVYQRALDLVESADRFTVCFSGRRRHMGWHLHRSATGVVLNIAEGNGRSTGPDRAHFMLMALGSTLECAALMDLAERLDIGSPEDRTRIKELADEIVRMLSVLSRNTRNRQPADPGRSYS